MVFLQLSFDHMNSSKELTDKGFFYICEGLKKVPSLHTLILGLNG